MMKMNGRSGRILNLRPLVPNEARCIAALELSCFLTRSRPSVRDALIFSFSLTRLDFGPYFLAWPVLAEAI